ncbi:hypothetical protein [Streptomyces sp. NPDC020917]|uniref:YxiG-like protein n=1 Tax=Streptomyces sp. NPDC020917 TaxID=3365102 RepID=UPI00378F83A3
MTTDGAAAELREKLDEVFDQSIVHHGFTPYMRDYEIVIHAMADPRTGIQPAYLRYLFRYCVQAHCESTVHPATWRASLDDRLTDYETGADLDGFVWGVAWQPMYPGASVVTDSATARRWAQEVGIDFHEVRIESNAHRLTLVFSDLEVSEVAPGYAPYTAD